MPTSAQVRVIDPILTTHVQGFIHPEHIGMKLFPAIPVASSGGKVIEFGKEAFRLYKTARSPGTSFKRLNLGHKGVPYALENHGLEAVVPREHQREASVVPGIDLAANATSEVMMAESLILENDQANMARDLSAYGANHKTTLSGTDQWNDYANSDPVKDIKEAKEAIRASTGVYPTVIEIPALVMAVLTEHPKVIDKIKFTQTAVLTEQLLAVLFGVQEVVVGKAIAFDDADATIDVWGKDVILAYVPRIVTTMRQPSYGYTYTMNGNPSVEQPYWEDGTKSWVYGVSYERAPVLSGISSGFIINNAVA